MTITTKLPIKISANNRADFDMIEALLAPFEESFLKQFEDVSYILYGLRFMGKYQMHERMICAGTITYMDELQEEQYMGHMYRVYRVATDVIINSKVVKVSFTYRVLHGTPFKLTFQ